MNIVSKVTGDSLTANEFNQIPDEMENLITSGGISPSDLDLQQMSKAIAQYCADGNFFVASGTPDAIILSTNGTRIPPVSLTNGFKARFKAVANNTGNCTINVANLGAKSIYFDGNQLQAGEIKAGNFYEVEYDFSNDYFVIKKEVYSSVKSFDILSSLIADTTVKDGDICITSGYYSVNDGGSGLYTIREKTVADVENGGTIIFISNNLVAELVILNSFVNVKQFGAKGDGITDDITAIQTAIDIANSINCNVFIPEGNYLISTSIDLKEKAVSLIGAGVGTFDTAPPYVVDAKTRITATSGMSLMIDIHNTSLQQKQRLVEIGGFLLDGNSISGIIGIDINYLNCTRFKDLYIHKVDIGLQVQNDWLNEYNNVRIITASTNCLYIKGGSNTVVYNHCGFTNCATVACKVTGTSTALSFRDCDIEFNSGKGMTVDIGPDTLLLSNVYFEANYLGALEVISGIVKHIGGVIHYWYNGMTDSYAYITTGGYIEVENVLMSSQCTVYPQTAQAFNAVVSGGEGKIAFSNGGARFLLGATWKGDVLLWKDGFTKLVPNWGREFASTNFLYGSHLSSTTKLFFKNCKEEPSFENVLTGETSGTTAKVVLVKLTSGSYSDGDASGYIYINNPSGSFTDGENITNTTTTTTGALVADGTNCECVEICVRNNHSGGGGGISIYHTIEPYNVEGTLQLVTVAETNIHGYWIPRISPTNHGNQAPEFGNFGTITYNDANLLNTTITSIRCAYSDTTHIQLPYFCINAYGTNYGDYLILYSVSLSDRANRKKDLSFDICKF